MTAHCGGRIRPPQWDTVLPAGLVAGDELRLRLVMTKFGDPGVTIAYEVRLEPPA